MEREKSNKKLRFFFFECIVIYFFVFIKRIGVYMINFIRKLVKNKDHQNNKFKLVIELRRQQKTCENREGSNTLLYGYLFQYKKFLKNKINFSQPLEENDIYGSFVQ